MIMINTVALRKFELTEIVMRDKYQINAYNKDAEYLLSIDENRLLAGFYENAGIKTHFIRYNGWENSLIAGHSLGHYLTAAAQCYANPLTSDERKEKISKKISAIISGLLECQKNSKGKKGFIWGANVVSKRNVEIQFDNVEKNKTNIVTQAWVPWYTLHKIIAGLVAVCNFTPNVEAKTVLTELCDWVYRRVSQWDEKTRETVLNIEYGGMNDCLYDAYKITGKKEYLTAAHVFDEEKLFETALSNKENALNNLHSNTTIPKFLGALNRYVTVGDERYLEYAKAFFDMIVEKHAYVTGDVSEWEHFGKDNILDGERTQYNCETCAAYNMLMIAKLLFMITKEKKYADYYENTYFNTILAAQNPESGMAMYFQPMATGFFKVFSSPFDSFWCCTGTGMEDFTKLGDSIYFKDDESVYINAFISSSVFWREKNITITQETDIPVSDEIRLSFETDNPKEFTVKIRIPDWATDSPKITLNGRSFNYSLENGYAVVKGVFSYESEICITIPFSIKAYGLKDNENVFSFKYGPIVLCAQLGRDRMDIGTTGVQVSVPKRAILASKTIRCVDMSKNELIASPEKYFTKKDKTSFILNGCDREYIFVPYYSEHQNRYGIYWYFKDASENEPNVEETREIIDTVQPGYGQYENDALHNMKERKSVGCTSDGTYRYAKKGGFFTYRMKVEPDRKNYLVCYFRKTDSGKSIKAMIGNKILFEKILDYNGDGELYEIKTEIPKKLIERYKRDITAIGEHCTVIPLKFESGDKNDSAKVCEFIYITH